MAHSHHSEPTLIATVGRRLGQIRADIERLEALRQKRVGETRMAGRH